MKNLKLSFKIGLSFGIVLIIMAVLFGITIFKLSEIQEESEILEKEYIPEIQVYSNLERSLNKTVYAMRVYSDTRETTYLNNAKENFKDVKKYINKAEKSFTRPEKSKSIKELSKLISEYGAFINASNEKIENIKIHREKLEKASQEYRTGCGEFLEKINEHYMDEIYKIDLDNDKLVDYYEKITSLNDLISFGTLVEKKAEKAFVDRNISLLKESINIFDLILGDVDMLEVSTMDKDALTKISTIKEGAIEFKKSANILISTWDSLALFEKNSKIAADNIVKKAEHAVRKDIETTIFTVEKTTKKIDTANKRILLGFIFTLIICVIISLLLTKIITEPVYQSLDFSRKMSNGDFTASMNLDRHDEIGKMMISFDKTKQSLGNMMSQISNTSTSLFDASDELSKISESSLTTVNKLVEKTRGVTSASEKMSENMLKLNMTMEDTSSSVNMVSAAAEEMNSTISEIAKSTSQARSITNDAVTTSSDTSEKVLELKGAADEINRVVEVITEISEQTNLLALNATIEAARAGDAGKGFAVVASEIKELANQTTNATEEIKSKIDGIQNNTDTTVSGIKNINSVITKIDDIVSTIASAVEEQSASTNEIANNISMVSHGVDVVKENVNESSNFSKNIAEDIAEVDRFADNITDKFRRLTESADVLSSFANALKKMVGKFKF